MLDLPDPDPAVEHGRRSTGRGAREAELVGEAAWDEEAARVNEQAREAVRRTSVGAKLSLARKERSIPAFF